MDRNFAPSSLACRSKKKKKNCCKRFRKTSGVERKPRASFCLVARNVCSEYSQFWRQDLFWATVAPCQVFLLATMDGHTKLCLCHSLSQQVSQKPSSNHHRSLDLKILMYRPATAKGVNAYDPAATTTCSSGLCVCERERELMVVAQA